MLQPADRKRRMARRRYMSLCTSHVVRLFFVWCHKWSCSRSASEASRLRQQYRPIRSVAVPSKWVCLFLRYYCAPEINSTHHGFAGEGSAYLVEKKLLCEVFNLGVAIKQKHRRSQDFWLGGAQTLKNSAVFTEIESEFWAEIGNSNDFSAQIQVISKKKKKKKKKGLHRNWEWFFGRNR